LIVLNVHNTVFARSSPLYATGVSLAPRVVNANGIWNASTIFAALTRWQTDRPRYSVSNNRRSAQWRSQILLLSKATTSIYWSSRLDRSDQLQQSTAIFSCKTRRDAVYLDSGDTLLFTYLLMHKVFSSCIRRCLVSCACNWVMPALSAVLLTFSFQFSLVFCALTQFPVLYILLEDLDVIWRRNQATLCTFVMPYRKPALILAGNVFCTQRTAQGKDFKLFLTVKMGTRHHIGGPFGREFLAFVIIAELWWPEVIRRGNFVCNFCGFFKCQNFGCLSNCCYSTDCAQNLPGPAPSPTFGSQSSKFHPNWLTFSGVIAECVKAVLLAHRVFAIFARTLGK